MPGISGYRKVKCRRDGGVGTAGLDDGRKLGGRVDSLGAEGGAFGRNLYLVGLAL